MRRKCNVIFFVNFWDPSNPGAPGLAVFSGRRFETALAALLVLTATLGTRVTNSAGARFFAALCQL